jgi:hypothetical protein
MQKIDAKREKWDAWRKRRWPQDIQEPGEGNPEHTRVPRIRDLVHSSNGIGDPDQMIHSRW